jgi:DNA primase
VVIRKAQWLGKGAAPQALPNAPSEPMAEPTFEALSVLPLAAAVPIEPPALSASPMPQTAREVPLEIKDNEVTLTLGEGAGARRYRICGLAKNLAMDVLKVNLMVSCNDAASTGSGQTFHVDTLDLYAAKQRASYIAQAATETGCDARLLKNDLGRVLLAFEQLQDDTIRDTLRAAPEPQMEEADQRAALALHLPT